MDQNFTLGKSLIKIKSVIVAGFMIWLSITTISFGQTPVINSFTPQAGPVGTLVTVSGKNLDSVNTFTVGGTKAIVISNSSSLLVGMIMPGTVTGILSLTTKSGSANSQNSFSVGSTKYPISQQDNVLFGGVLSGITPSQGFSTAISADGNTAILGAPGEGDGVAVVYTRKNGNWSDQGVSVLKPSGTRPGTSKVGYSVAISADGNTALVGAPYDENSLGGAWIFTRSSSGVWSQQGNKLTGTGYSGTANQGVAVALSADGSIAVIGGAADDVGNGAVWVFKKSGGNLWLQNGNKLVGAGNAGAAAQGSSVAISADGNTIGWGGVNDNSGNGAVWIYNKSGDSWISAGSKLVGSDATLSAKNRGISLAFNADGTTVIIGGSTNNTNNPGHTWVFTKSSSGQWTQQGNLLVGTGNVNNADQGRSVSISADGNTAIIGGPFDNSNQGAVWTFTRSSGNWTQTGTKLTGTGNTEAAQQGYSVSLSADGNTSLIGGPKDDFGYGGGWIFISGVSDARLSGLNLSAGTLSPAFSKTNTGYAASVSNSVSFVKITPICNVSGATVKINNVSLSSDSTGKTVSLNTGLNKFSITVTAQDGISTQEYTLQIQRALSSDASLSSLSISSGVLSPTFSGTVSAYSVTVANTISSLSFSAVLSDPNGSAKINGNVLSGTAVTVPLSLGQNTVNVVVTAQDGATSKTYTITVYRPLSSNAGLSSLTISEGVLSPAFSGSVSSYSATVSNTPSNIMISPVLSDLNATLKVNGNGLSGTGVLVPLNFGQNIINIVVTAQDGVTKKNYVLTVYGSLSQNADLASLTISSGNFSPTFSGADAPFSATVSNTTSSIAVSPVASDPYASVKVNGNTFSGTGISVPLSAGQNTINLAVTAQDGVTTKIYVLTIYRSLSTNANLSSLNISPGVLSPIFSGSVTSFSTTVSNTTASIIVSPVASDMNATVKINGNVLTGTGGTIPLNSGQNSVNIIVTAQDGITTKVYDLTVYRLLSSNASLSSLSLSEGTLSPVFSGTMFTYSTTVSNVVSNITFSPTASDIKATISVNGNVLSGKGISMPLSLGQNTISFVVTAQDGSTSKTYTVIVYRLLSSNASLSSLTISKGKLSPAFSGAVTSYSTTVSDTTEFIVVNPVPSDSNAKIKVDWMDLSGTGAGLYVNAGQNTIKIVVTAQDGLTTKTYVLNVYRPLSSNADLSLFAISQGSLSPMFSGDLTSYSATVSNAITHVTVSAVTSELHASLKVNGKVLSFTETDVTVPLNVGSNTIIAAVTAQDGITTKTYTLKVYRSLSTNADLSYLSISQGVLSPAFSGAVTSYSATVSNLTSNITISAAASDSNASFRINGNVFSGTAIEVPLSVGQNTIDFVVTAQDGVTQKNYSLLIVRALSGNAELSSLSIAPGRLSPTFSGAGSIFSSTLSEPSPNVFVSAQTSEPHATITVNGQALSTTGSVVSLTAGLNAISIQVIAEDNVTSKTYTLLIQNPYSSNADLSTLGLSTGALPLSPAMSVDGGLFTQTVSSTTELISLSPDPADANATVKINGEHVSKAVLIPLQFGLNTIRISITAQDGINTKYYTLSVIRLLSSNASLSSLRLSQGTLSPVFSEGIKDYQAVLPSTTSEVSIFPVLSDSLATVKVNGKSLVNKSITLPLYSGMNSFIIAVTAQDGITVKYYTLDITRSLSSDAGLSSLSASPGILSPSFSGVLTSYSMTVSNITNTIQINPVLNNPNASLSINNVSFSGTGMTVPISVGLNTVILKVTAEDGVSFKSYVLSVQRLASSDASLFSLSLSSGKLSPVFSGSVTTYSATVPKITDSIRIVSIANNQNAVVRVNGNLAGVAGVTALPFAGDSSVITIKVTAQDGITDKVYTVKVLRGNPTINSLFPESGAIGTLLSIKGEDLNIVDTFIVGGMPLFIVSRSATSVTGLIMPGTKSGYIALKSKNGLISSGVSFQVLATPFPTLQQGEKLAGPLLPASGNTGSSVAISADGNTAVTGAPGANGGQGTLLVYSRNNGIWSLSAKLSGLSGIGFSKQGYAVSISADGKTIAAGGPDDNSMTGAVWVFYNNGQDWLPQGGKLTGTSSLYMRNASFGYSVSLSADGNTLVVGAPGMNFNHGGVFVYYRISGSWQQDKIVLTGNGVSAGGERQGSAVSVSADGNSFIEGACLDNGNQGAVYLFKRTGKTWVQQGDKLVGSGNSGPARQGVSVGINADGTVAAVGGPYDNNNKGALWIFKLTNDKWIQQGEKLSGSGNSGVAFQGFSVAITADGAVVFESGYGDGANQGAVWAFGLQGNQWKQSGGKFRGSGNSGAAKQGVSIGLTLNGSAAMVGGSNDNAGAGASWVFGSQPSGTIINTGSVSDRSVSNSISEQTLHSDSLILYPNPVTESVLSVKTGFAKSEIYSLRVLSMAGSVLMNESLFIGASETIYLNVSRLSHGVYTLQLVNKEGKIYNKQFIKM